MTTQDADPWRTIPRHMRSIVRAYINSDQPEDCERAMEFCAHYRLDYLAMRNVIMDEMIAQSQEIIAAKESETSEWSTRPTF